MKPAFTLIVPTLNEEKHLAEELKALRRLAPKAEIIVSDGRSTDDTRKIARELADKVVMQAKIGRASCRERVCHRV